MDTSLNKYRVDLRFCIRRQRLLLGLTQAAAAARVGLSRPEYAHLENGSKPCSLDRLVSTALALGLWVRLECLPAVRSVLA